MAHNAYSTFALKPEGPSSVDDTDPDRKDRAFEDSDGKSISDSDSSRSGLGLRCRRGPTFANEEFGEHLVPLPTYEGYHRYDPEFQWEPKEEKRLVRLLDMRICSFVCLCFFALQLDRGNIVQAVSDNMLGDLGLNTNNYNYGQTIFYISFLCAELPSQMVSKWVGPDNWIPVQMICWSIVASCQAFLTGKSSFYATRCLLGVLEGGFIPDNILYLSYFYTSSELPRRLSFFWTAYQATYIVGAFMAFGLLHLNNVNGLAGWRWLFAIEGTLTGLIGIVCWFYLPPSPTQTAGGLRGKGWFNEREEKIMVNRILRDDPSKGDMHNRQYISWKQFGHALTDYDLWPIYLLGLSWMIPAFPMTQYLTLQLESDGFGVFQTNLLSIPAYTIFIINLLLWTFISEYLNERFLVSLMSQVWMLPLLIVLEVQPANFNQWARYAVTILLVGYPYMHAIIVAVVSRNAGTVRTRTVATAIYNMSVQASNVIAINIYRTKDAPLYRTGNKVLLAICGYNFLLFLFAKFYYVTRNKRKAAKWNAMTKDEKAEYLATTTDKGNRRLDFRFAH